MERLSGKTAIITGGASGLGAASVRRFVEEGAFVAIADVDASLGKALESELPDGKSLFIQTDVSDRLQIERMMKRVVEWRGAIDILFNNAGVTGIDRVEDMAPAVWDRVIAIDLSALFHCCRTALPNMPKPGGIIINMASISGMGGEIANPAYNAAKGGVINFTRSLAVDYGREGVRVNAICPGLIVTEGTRDLFTSSLGQASVFSQIPLQRIGEPGEVANLALFLASEESSYINGSIIAIDGGVSAATGWPDLRKLI